MAIITNKNNLPQALVDYVKSTEYSPTEKHYSVTTLIRGTTETILSRRHNDEIEVDVNEKVNMLFGTAVHHILEQFDKTGFAEIYFKEEIRDGYYLSGKLDLYNPTEFSVEDWKTASVTKIQRQDFADWKKQGLMYAWLCYRQGKHVGKIRFHAILKDWSPSKKREAQRLNEFYPKAQIYTWKHTVSVADLQEIEKYIYERFNALIALESVEDKDLPPCSNEDTWYTGDHWCVIKKGGVKAYRKYETMQEAQDCYNGLKNKQEYQVIQRLGVHRKCQDYCAYCKFCKHYEKRKGE